MKISVLCSSPDHPVYPRLGEWCATQRQAAHAVELVQRSAELSGGDLLFLVSCTEIIHRATREQYGATLVLHASALPYGRGWSPHVWQILEGANQLTLTLLAAEDAVDTGDIWAQEVIQLEGHELYNEINDLLFAAELRLMTTAVQQGDRITPRPQAAEPATYYRKRMPEDSRIDPQASIASQFDLLRVCDAVRFPAFFEYRGRRYTIQIKKQEPKP